MLLRSIRCTRPGPRTGAGLILLALAIAELGLRMAGPIDGVHIVKHQEYGWVALPNEDVVKRGVSIHINSDGFRDVDWAPPGLASDSVLEGGRKGLRIAVLGDSIVFGTGVPSARRGTEVLSRKLSRAMPEQNVLVMNFAFFGYSMDQMKSTYFGVVQAWKPDIVVVAINPGSLRPRPPVGNSSWVRRLLIRTALYNSWLKHGPSRRESFLGNELEAKRHNQIEKALKKSPFSVRSAPYWQNVVLDLLEIRDQQAKFGGAVAVLAIPNFSNVLQPDKVRIATFLANDLKDASIQIIDPVALFRESGGRKKVQQVYPEWPAGLLFFADDYVHLTAEGQRLVGVALATQLDIPRAQDEENLVK